MTGGLMVVTGLAAFSGLVADPVQRRLHRMLDVLESEFPGGGTAGFQVRDHYVARLLDLLDYIAMACRAAA